MARRLSIVVILSHSVTCLRIASACAVLLMVGQRYGYAGDAKPLEVQDLPQLPEFDWQQLREGPRRSHVQVRSDSLLPEFKQFREQVAAEPTKDRIAALSSDLLAKHKDDPYACYSILLETARLCRIHVREAEPAKVAAKQAAETLDRLQADLAWERAKLAMFQGEIELSAEKPKDAAAFFREVLAIPVISYPYFLRVGELQGVYIRAVERLFGLLSDKELRSLEVMPFAQGALAATWPEKVRLLPGDLDVAKFRVRVLRWLRLVQADLPEKDPRREHVDAVIQLAEKEFGAAPEPGANKPPLPKGRKKN